MSLSSVPSRLLAWQVSFQQNAVRPFRRDGGRACDIHRGEPAWGRGKASRWGARQSFVAEVRAPVRDRDPGRAVGKGPGVGAGAGVTAGAAVSSGGVKTILA